MGGCAACCLEHATLVKHVGNKFQAESMNIEHVNCSIHSLQSNLDIMMLHVGECVRLRWLQRSNKVADYQLFPAL